MSSGSPAITLLIEIVTVAIRGPTAVALELLILNGDRPVLPELGIASAGGKPNQTDHADNRRPAVKGGEFTCT